MQRAAAKGVTVRSRVNNLRKKGKRRSFANKPGGNRVVRPGRRIRQMDDAIRASLDMALLVLKELTDTGVNDDRTEPLEVSLAAIAASAHSFGIDFEDLPSEPGSSPAPAAGPAPGTYGTQGHSFDPSKVLASFTPCNLGYPELNDCKEEMGTGQGIPSSSSASAGVSPATANFYATGTPSSASAHAATGIYNAVENLASGVSPHQIDFAAGLGHAPELNDAGAPGSNPGAYASLGLPIATPQGGGPPGELLGALGFSA